MQPHRPDIFVSATSADLGTCRLVVKEALLTLGCYPVEQANFPPEASTVREMLRKRISACHAVVHVVGIRYGAEPTVPQPDHPRRSYTQLEYEIGQELGKPLYVFICGEGFDYDPHDPEEPERHALQQEYRRRLIATDNLYTSVGTRGELQRKVLTLQARVETLVGEL